MAKFAVLSASEIEALIPTSAASVGLMASYEETPGIARNLVQYLECLSPHFDNLLLLTNRRDLPNADELPPNCGIYFYPNDQCRDFGMWARVLNQLPCDRYKRLTRLGLFNDSCFVVHDFQSCFERARLGEFEFWGLVPNAEPEPHIQSFFLIADTRESVELLCKFFHEKDMDTYVNADKQVVIDDFEVGLSRYMLQHVRLNTVFNYGHLDLVQTALTDPALRDRGVLRLINMSHHKWDVLLAMGCPLLKKARANLGIDERLLINQFVQPAFYPLESAAEK